MDGHRLRELADEVRAILEGQHDVAMRGILVEAATRLHQAAGLARVVA